MDENDAMVCSAGFSTPGVAEATTTNTATYGVAFDGTAGQYWSAWGCV